MGNEIIQLGHNFPSTSCRPGWARPACLPPPSPLFPKLDSELGTGDSTLPRDVTFTRITFGPICGMPPHPLHWAANPHKAPRRARHDKQAPHRPPLHQACSQGPRRDSERLSLSLPAALIGFPTRRGQQKCWGEENQREGASSR